ncbi:hypothetical protein EPO56_03495 [Patescibacteria group bacterium]|nr:MAG: hypothetical protein EPO56_03495 [Patescibacteria group bacterium]
MHWVKPTSEISKTDVALAGGKGASLGEMTQAGILVPGGFVILSSAFENFLKETHLNIEIEAALDTVNHKETHTVENASEKIQTLILEAEIPKNVLNEIKNFFKKLDTKYVAVRSSATAEDSANAAWAGQLESYLNTTEETLLENVKRCWASLFTPRAIFYRFEKELHKQKISVAVVVQKMIQSEKSGIAFSVHPVTEDHNQLIIEAGFGLGESIVSGAVRPDSYVVQKSPEKIIDIVVNTQSRALYQKPEGGNEWKDLDAGIGTSQVLSQEQILNLSKVILNIEKHYGFPCDIEWAFEKDKFYITQSRPITTLKAKNTAPNLLEVLGVKWQFGVTRNMSFLHQCLSSAGHFFDTQDFGVKVHQIQLALTEHGTHTSIFTDPANMKDYVAAILETINTTQKVTALKNKYETFAKDLFISLDNLNKEQTKEAWIDFSKKYQRMSAGLFLTTVIGRAGGDLLAKKLKEVGVTEQTIPDVIGLITYPDEHTPLFNSQLDLLIIVADQQKGKVFDLDDQLTGWLNKYGYIPVNFCDEPWSIEDIKTQFDSLLKKDCVKEVERYVSDNKNKIKLKKEKLDELNNNEITTIAYAIAEGTYLNEFRKSVFSKVSLSYRNFFRTVAQKINSSDWRDCFYLMPDEITKILNGEKLDIEIIKKERDNIAYYISSSINFIVLNQEELAIVKAFIAYSRGEGDKTQQIQVTSENQIKGYSANRGVVRGVARIILSSKDFDKLQAGEILVTTMTSVDFVPIMERAGAFVTNEGGITSHASIVAREMNKPCIIGTQNGTRIIKDGDLVEVNGNSGIVSVLK